MQTLSLVKPGTVGLCQWGSAPGITADAAREGCETERQGNCHTIQREREEVEPTHLEVFQGFQQPGKLQAVLLLPVFLGRAAEAAALPRGDLQQGEVEKIVAVADAGEDDHGHQADRKKPLQSGLRRNAAPVAPFEHGEPRQGGNTNACPQQIKRSVEVNRQHQSIQDTPNPRRLANGG